jgi:hypothetical protein
MRHYYIGLLLLCMICYTYKNASAFHLFKKKESVFFPRHEARISIVWQRPSLSRACRQHAIIATRCCRPQSHPVPPPVNDLILHTWRSYVQYSMYNIKYIRFHWLLPREALPVFFKAYCFQAASNVIWHIAPLLVARSSASFNIQMSSAILSSCSASHL